MARDDLPEVPVMGAILTTIVSRLATMTFGEVIVLGVTALVLLWFFSAKLPNLPLEDNDR